MGIKKFKNAFRTAKANESYLKFMGAGINNKTIILESNQGRGPASGLSALLTCQELNHASEDSQVYITVTGKTKEETETFLSENGVKNVKLVKRGDMKYRELLATAGTIITDNALPAYYIKKAEQKLIVVGDALLESREGRSNISESKNLGLIQKTLLAADKIEGRAMLTKERVLREFMVGDIIDGTVKIYYVGDLTREEIRLLTDRILSEKKTEKIVIAFENELKPAVVKFLEEMDESVGYIQLVPDGAVTFSEYIYQYMYKTHGMMGSKIQNYYERESRRLFAGMEKCEIHFLTTELFERIEAIILSGARTVFHKVPMLFYRRLIDVFAETPGKRDQVAGRFDETVDYEPDYGMYIWSSCICDGVDARYRNLKISSDAEKIRISADIIVRSSGLDYQLRDKFVLGSLTHEKRFRYDADLSLISSSISQDIETRNYRMSVEIPCGDVNNWYIKNVPLLYLACKDITIAVPVLSALKGAAFSKNVYNIGETGCAMEIRREFRYLRLGIKEQKVSDQPVEKFKLAMAFALSVITFWNKPILLCEKYCQNYEESASILFERLVDEGYRNVRFVLNKNSMAREGIDPKYQKYIVDQFSFAHYYNLFASKSIISSEAIGHCLEKETASTLFKTFVEDGSKNYVFLQHGVMYMVALSSEQRSFFRKGKGKGKQRVVVSSQLEANHFTDYTNYTQDDIYVCGLIKFDRSIMNEGADKILVMLTWRPWEFVTGLNGMKETAYYKMLQRIVRSIPDDLKDKLIVMPHPLIASQAKLEPDDEVWKYYVHGMKYDDILKDTKLLITDYSSIAYDAFFRGTNVIFDWKEKDDCMKEYGSNGRLMLTEDLAFGHVCYDENEMTASVTEGYYGPQKDEHISNYRKLVEFNDRDNCGRFIKMAKADGIL